MCGAKDLMGGTLRWQVLTFSSSPQITEVIINNYQEIYQNGSLSDTSVELMGKKGTEKSGKGEGQGDMV